jgi:hypothetical protein
VLKVKASRKRQTQMPKVRCSLTVRKRVYSVVSPTHRASVAHSLYPYEPAPTHVELKNRVPFHGLAGPCQKIGEREQCHAHLMLGSMFQEDGGASDEIR